MENRNLKKEYHKPTCKKQKLFERYALFCSCAQVGGCIATKQRAPSNNVS